jgi:hypothetical protein
MKRDHEVLKMFAKAFSKLNKERLAKQKRKPNISENKVKKHVKSSRNSIVSA